MLKAPRNRQASRPSWLTDGATVLAILTPLSLAIFAYERTLVPLYALGPTQFLLNKIVCATIAFSSLGLFTLSISKAILLAGILLSAAPTTSYWVAVLTSRMRDPLSGPVITHIVVMAPIVYVFANVVMKLDVSVYHLKFRTC
jgi:hypothetical protein